MDLKTLEISNLRLLNDYLNQTIDVLSRQPRSGQPWPAQPQGSWGFSPFGFSPFSPAPTAAGVGTDTVHGTWGGAPFWPQASWGQQAPWGGASPFPGQPFFGSMDPFFAQRSYNPTGYSPFGQAGYSPFGPMGYSPFGPASFSPFGMSPWAPMSEATRQAQLSQAYAARQSVFEAMCRAMGIPV